MLSEIKWEREKNKYHVISHTLWNLPPKSKNQAHRSGCWWQVLGGVEEMGELFLFILTQGVGVERGREGEREKESETERVSEWQRLSEWVSEWERVSEGERDIDVGEKKSIGCLLYVPRLGTKLVI